MSRCGHISRCRSFVFCFYFTGWRKWVSIVAISIHKNMLLCFRSFQWIAINNSSQLVIIHFKLCLSTGLICWKIFTVESCKLKTPRVFISYIRFIYSINISSSIRYIICRQNPYSKMTHILTVSIFDVKAQN